MGRVTGESLMIKWLFFNKAGERTAEAARLVACLPTIHASWVLSLALRHLGVMVCTVTPAFGRWKQKDNELKQASAIQ